MKYLAMLMAAVDLIMGGGVGYAWSRKIDTTGSYSLTIAAPLALRTAAFGPDELEKLKGWLTTDLDAALAERQAQGLAPVALSLVLDDARPSRPLKLSMQTGAAAPPRQGGVAISGEMVGADGRRTPVLYRAYRRAKAAEAAPETWADAKAAFQVFADMVAQDRLDQCAAKAACMAASPASRAAG